MKQVFDIDLRCVYMFFIRNMTKITLRGNIEDNFYLKNKIAEIPESWKSKRADDRMHNISFHADKICHSGKYGKQPNTKYQMLSEK